MPASQRPDRPTPGALDVPRWAWIPAAVGVALITLPLIALLTRVNWTELPALLTSPSSVTALLLSLRTSVIATVLCLMLGLPLALVVARLRFRGRDLVRSLVLLPLVLPPVVAGIALLSSVGVVLMTLLLALASILIWPFRVLWRLLTGKRARALPLGKTKWG